MGTIAHLTAATDRNGKFSGYYKCSLCSAEFRPNPKDRGELSRTFEAHVKHSHSDAKIDVRQAPQNIAKEDREN
jgi:hypothetical protein